MFFLLFLLVSPEAIGFLSAVGVFVILMLLLFLYINKKMCFENVSGFPDLDSGYTTRKNSQDKLCKYLKYSVLSLVIRMYIFRRMCRNPQTVTWLKWWKRSIAFSHDYAVCGKEETFVFTSHRNSAAV